MTDSRRTEPSSFGLLTARTANLGDDIQALAALQFLPGASVLVDRDRLAETRLAHRASVIMNGWWMNYPERFPTADCGLDPLLVSIHVARTGILSNDGVTVTQALQRQPVLDYLRTLGPVGCRDLATVELLSERGLAATFTGCLTLTLRRITEPIPAPAPYLLAIDVPRRLSRVLRRDSSCEVVEATNWIHPQTDPLERLVAARHRLMQVQAASAVVTTRLHIALPCLAMGTPVIWLVGSESDGRLSTYRDWVSSVQQGDAEHAVRAMAAASLPVNPQAHTATAETLTDVVAGWVDDRSGLARTDPFVATHAALTAEAIRRWSQLEEASSRRVRQSRRAWRLRAVDRWRLVSD